MTTGTAATLRLATSTDRLADRPEFPPLVGARKSFGEDRTNFRRYPFLTMRGHREDECLLFRPGYYKMSEEGSVEAIGAGQTIKAGPLISPTTLF
eukprot:CAMPEP_0174894178 /NCGR_PEP_ID=MMETSP0167-20121228/8863_1 /TAXON_ID=38298 /ORGANISM="Rhodella maculata, Strain CCMP736" /LENGTH=94 /DNA_ID=CAMNT_0016133189 /DNA_START=397 /DNA_END=678 /DNA_ORIENTATION=+